MRELRMSNEELIAALKSAWRDEGNLMAQCIARLADVDERRLYLDVASPSLFDFCVRKIGMSEGEAFRRMTAARLVLKHPQILVALEAQHIHLSSIVLARKLFRTGNADAILEQISGKTRREVQKLVACMMPRPDVPSSIRKMRTAKPAPALKPGSGDESESGPALAPASLPLILVPASSAAPSDRTPSREPLGTSATDAPNARAPLPVILVSEQILPLAATRHHVQFTASTELREKLERAQSLMRHRNMDGDLAVVVDRAVDLLIAKLEKEKLGTTSKPRSAKKTAPVPSRTTSSYGAGRHVTSREATSGEATGSDSRAATSRARVGCERRRRRRPPGKLPKSARRAPRRARRRFFPTRTRLRQAPRFVASAITTPAPSPRSGAARRGAEARSPWQLGVR